MSFFKIVITLTVVLEIVVSFEGGVGPNNRKPLDLTNKPKITVDDEPKEMENMDEDTFITEQWTHPDDMIHEKYNNHDDMENLKDNLMKEQLPSPEMNHKINDNHEASQRKPGYFNGKCDGNFGCYSNRCNLTTGSCLCSTLDHGCKMTNDCCGKLSVCMVGKCKPLKPPGYLNTPCEEPAHCISNNCNTHSGLCGCSHHYWPCQNGKDCCGELTKCTKGKCIAYYKDEKCITKWDCFSYNCRDDKTCGCSKTIGHANYCRTTSDCCHGIKCVNGECPHQVAGKTCAEPYNCRSYRCISGQCDCLYAGDASSCVHTGDGCCNKRCLRRSCDLSRFKEPCLVNEHCYSNKCTDKMCGNECLETIKQACNVSKECCHGQAYKCQGGHCCKLNRETCAKDGHCCSGRCILGTCDLLNVNEACGSGDECHTTYCIALKCVCVPLELICSSDIQCCKDLYCVGGLCAQCKKYDDECTQHLDCCGRYCSSSICKCKPVGQWCEVASQCCPDLICLEGKCTKCFEENEPCPGRIGCCKGQCHDGYCKEPIKFNEKCELTSECLFADPNTECSKDNKCLIALEKPCSKHDDCASNLCTSKLCKCISDPDIKCTSNNECCHGNVCQKSSCCGLPGGNCLGIIKCCSNVQCFFGRCEKIHFNEPCTKHEDCDSDTCMDGLCRCSKDNQLCRGHNDCCDGLACFEHKCGNKRQTGIRCEDNKECITNLCDCISAWYGICPGKFCMCKQFNCDGENQCCPPEICQDSKCCIPDGKKCQTYSHCCKGSACIEGVCRQCIAEGEYCDHDNCCPYNFFFFPYCINHICKRCISRDRICIDSSECCDSDYPDLYGYTNKCIPTMYTRHRLCKRCKVVGSKCVSNEDCCSLKCSEEDDDECIGKDP